MTSATQQREAREVFELARELAETKGTDGVVRVGDRLTIYRTEQISTFAGIRFDHERLTINQHVSKDRLVMLAIWGDQDEQPPLFVEWKPGPWCQLLRRTAFSQ